MLQRDFISSLPAKGLLLIAEIILSYLDAKSLCAAELVCKEWLRVISDGQLWKKLIERQVNTDPMWMGLSQHRGWSKYLFKNNLYFNKNTSTHEQHKFYKDLYFKIIKDKEVSDQTDCIKIPFDSSAYALSKSKESSYKNSLIIFGFPVL